jgi:hypothetical protein
MTPTLFNLHMASASDSCRERVYSKEDLTAFHQYCLDLEDARKYHEGRQEMVLRSENPEKAKTEALRNIRNLLEESSAFKKVSPISNLRERVSELYGVPLPETQ